MANKKFYWLKLKEDFFRQKAIKKLRRIAGGDTYTIIYLKMLLLAIKNENKLYFEGVENTFFEEIALDLDEDADNVKITLSYLEQQGLLELVNNEEYLLTECGELVGKESDSAKRVRNHRANKQKALQCNANVTKSNIEIEIEIEKDIEIEIEKERDICNISKDILCSTFIERILEKWNSIGLTSKLVAIKPNTQRHKLLKARVKQYSEDEILEAINKVKESNFLMGRIKDFEITFDWFIRPNNFAKILDGNYKNKEKNYGFQSNNIENKAKIEGADGVDWSKF